jgi:hypothetical protein
MSADAACRERAVKFTRCFDDGPELSRQPDVGNIVGAQKAALCGDGMVGNAEGLCHRVDRPLSGPDGTRVPATVPLPYLGMARGNTR